jgi:predicted outer membrane protein
MHAWLFCIGWLQVICLLTNPPRNQALHRLGSQQKATGFLTLFMQDQEVVAASGTGGVAEVDAAEQKKKQSKQKKPSSWDKSVRFSWLMHVHVPYWP